jgi:hypothetical protein
MIGPSHATLSPKPLKSFFIIKKNKEKQNNTKQNQKNKQETSTKSSPTRAPETVAWTKNRKKTPLHEEKMAYFNNFFGGRNYVSQRQNALHC